MENTHTPTYPSEKGALDLPAAALSKARPASVATPWPSGVSSLSPPRETFHPFLNDCLTERPMASALFEDLKTVATEAKRSQTEDPEESL